MERTAQRRGGGSRFRLERHRLVVGGLGGAAARRAWQCDARRSVLQDVTGSLIYTEGPQIAAFGVSELVIVATPEHVLIVPREHDQMVRALAERSAETD